MSDLQALLAGLGRPPVAAPPVAPPSLNRLGFLEGLLRSTFSAGTKEFVGLPAPGSVEAWREQHPVGSIASQILGFGVPSLATAAIGTPVIGAAAKGLQSARIAAGIGTRVAPSVASAAAPLVRGAIEGAKIAAGSEAVRLGISVPFGDPKKVANEALYNIPLGGAFGAVFAGVPQYFRGLPSSQAKFLGMAAKQFPGQVDITAPPNIILQQLLNIKNSGAQLGDEANLVLDEVINGVVKTTPQGTRSSFPGLVNLILDQEAPVRKGARVPSYVAQLDPGFGDHRRINSFFDVGEAKGRIVSKMHQFGKGVEHDTAMVKHQLNADATYVKRDWLKGGGLGSKDYDQVFKNLSQAADLPDNWVADAVYPRLVRFKSPESSKRFMDTISDTLTPIGSSTQRYLGTERNGLHVMATRLPGDSLEKDMWILFKTHNPGRFEPRLEALKVANPIFPDLPKINAMDEIVTIDGARNVAQQRYLQLQDPKLHASPAIQVRLGNTQLGSYMERLMKAMPDDFEIQGLEEGKILDKMVERLLTGRPKEVAQDILHSSRAAFSSLDYNAKKLVSPLITQFRGSPIFQRISVMSQAMFSEAQKQAEELWRGKTALPMRKGKPISRPAQMIGRHFEPVPTSPSAMFSSFTPDEGKQYDMLRLMGLNSNTILGDLAANPKRLDWARWTRANNISAKVAQAIQKTVDLNMKILDEFNASSKALGVATIDIKPEHFSIVNTWKGSLRGQIIGDDGGVWVVDGNYRGEVIDKAKDILHMMEQNGVKGKFDPGAIKASGGLVDDFQFARTMLGTEKSATYQTIKKGFMEGQGRLTPSPQRVKSRSGVRGYVGDPYRPMSNQEREQAAFNSLLELKNLTAENLIKLQFGPDMARWQSAWPGLARQLDDRISKMAGRSSPSSFSIAFDEFFDPYFGRNSLDRLARSVNETMFTLTLGVGNVAFPAMNAVQWVQGALPEIALLKNAPPQVLQDLYEISMIPTKNGMFPAHSLSAPKLAMKALRRVFGTSEMDLKLMRKAAERGTIAPRWVDDFMGSTSRNANWRAFREGKTSFPDWLRGMNAFLPAESEKFTRMTTYFMGDDIARLAGMTDEVKIAQFADNFVRRTMYEYGPAARPNIFQGGLGKMAGLFKNWTFNYLANMRIYGSEAWKGIASGNLKRAEPMAWLLAGSGLLGGAGAMPGFFAFDKAVKMMTDKSFQDVLYDNVGDNPVSDTLYYGLPAFTGLTLQGNVEAPGADALRTVDMLFSSVIFDRMKSLGAAMEGAGNMLEHGMHPSQDKRVWTNLVRALAPRTLARGIQATNDGNLISLTSGNTIMDNVSLVESAAYAMGLTPLDVQKHYDAIEAAYADRDARIAGLEAYGEVAAQDMERGDYKTFNRTLRNAYLDGYNPMDVSKSAKERLRKNQEEVLDRQFGKDLETYKRMKRLGIND